MVAAIAAKIPPATEKTLANGLRVIVANRPGLPLVAADLRFSAGSALDPADRAGLATMTADLATRGTSTRSATDIARQIESLGASLGASAGADFSADAAGAAAVAGLVAAVAFGASASACFEAAGVLLRTPRMAAVGLE